MFGKENKRKQFRKKKNTKEFDEKKPHWTMKYHI
jgi:hypothetical protein